LANDRALGNYCVRKESPHRLIEGFMTDPEASVSALVCHYPDCVDFSVGGRAGRQFLISGAADGMVFET